MGLFNASSNIIKQYQQLPGLFQRGLSWEDMSRLPGLPVNNIKQYAEAKYPGYGIKPQQPKSNNAQRNTQHDSNSNSNQNLNLGYYGGGGGNTGGNRASAAQLAEYDQGIGQIEHGLGRVDNQLNARLGNIRDQYDTKQNELRSSWNRAEGQYNDQTRQNQQQRRTNINNINDRSAVGLRGLLRSLGSMGAVGSDMQLAGRAVQNQANQQRAGAGQTYAQNQRQIDSTWGQFKNDYEDEKKKSLEWKVNEDRAAQ